MVYFISDKEQKYCKIGKADNLKKRLKLLQTGHPLKLHVLTTFSGGLKEEQELHRKFKKYRLLGEWFTLSEEIINFISNELSIENKVFNYIIKNKVDNILILSDEHIDRIKKELNITDKELIIALTYLTHNYKLNKIKINHFVLFKTDINKVIEESVILRMEHEWKTKEDIIKNYPNKEIAKIVIKKKPKEPVTTFDSKTFNTTGGEQ